MGRLTLITLPFLLMAAVVVARLFIGPGAGLLPLLAVAPAFAAIYGGLRYTIVIGAVALAIAGVLGTLQFASTSLTQDVVALVAVVGVTAASMIASVARQRRLRELADVRAVAEVAQEVLLRPVPRQVDSVQLAVRYMSASSRARIGGDLYEVAPTPAGLRFIIGDAEGKGLPAVKAATVVLGAFREAAYDAPSLGAIAERIEASLARQITEEEFVTAILGQVSKDGSRIDMLNCGHPPPLLAKRAASTFVGPADGSLPLGLAGLADLPRIPDCIPFAPGECVLFYTDGVSEARNPAGDFFPLAAACCVSAGLEPEAALDRLSEEVGHHVGHPLDDDAAMLLIRHQAG